MRSLCLVGMTLLLHFKTSDGATQTTCTTKSTKWTLNDQELNVETCHPDVSEVVDEDFTISPKASPTTLGFSIFEEETVRNLPRNLSGVFPDLVFVEVRYTSVTTINVNHFKNLSKLKKLELSFNKISIIYSDCFHDLVSLESLDLSRNEIRSVGENIFATLKALRELFLNNNLIQKLHPSTFGTLRIVEYLNLDANEIGSLDENIFENMTSLKKIHLKNNKLGSFSKDLFKNNLELEVVEIGDIKKISQGATQASCNTKPTEWTLRNQERTVKTCRPAISAIDNENFTISIATLAMTEGFIIYAKQGIEFLPQNMFSAFPDLVFMRVQHTSVTTINENHFQNLAKLVHLDLAQNQINNISGNAFGDLISLEILDLGGNRIENLEENTFSGLKALKTLHLNSNQIKNLHRKIFEAPVELELVNLDANEIESLDENIFKSLTKLKEIHMMNNKLFVIQKALFENNLKLAYIHLGNNRINLIDSSTFDHLPNLKFVGIGGNLCVNKYYYAYDFPSMRNDFMVNCDEKSIRETLSITKNGLEGILALLTDATTDLRSFELKLQILEKKKADLENELAEKSEQNGKLKEKFEKMARAKGCNQTETTTLDP